MYRVQSGEFVCGYSCLRWSTPGMIFSLWVDRVVEEGEDKIVHSTNSSVIIVYWEINLALFCYMYCQVYLYCVLISKQCDLLSHLCAHHNFMLINMSWGLYVPTGTMRLDNDEKDFILQQFTFTSACRYTVHVYAQNAQSLATSQSRVLITVLQLINNTLSVSSPNPSGLYRSWKNLKSPKI